MWRKPLVGLIGLLLVVGGLMTACGESTSEPPWGLDEANLPETESDVRLVFETMGDVDGRQPTWVEDFGAVTYEGTESEAPAIYRSVSALPADEPAGSESLADAIGEVVAEAENTDTMTVVASNLDVADGLVWAVVDDSETDDGLAAYGILWTDGPWLFHASGDTPEFREAIVQEFLAATEEALGN